MPRKTKVRIVGDPVLCDQVCLVLLNNFDTDDPQHFERAVGRDYSHSQAPGKSIYIVIKGSRKEASS